MAWYVALGPWAHHGLFKWWPEVYLDLFYGKVKFGLLCFYMGKTVRKSFNGRNLQQMSRVTKGLCLYKNSGTKGLSAPAPGLYTCIKTWKIMYKIRLQRYFFQQMGKGTRLFCWHQDFVHKGLSAPAPGLYTCGKTLKNVYKIRHQDFVHKGLSAPAPGLYTCGKTLKNVYKIRIQRDLFETCNKWSKY